MGNSAHRYFGSGRILRAGRQGKLECGGGSDGILVEHLEKITHTKEHNGVWVLTLRFKILLHCWRSSLLCVANGFWRVRHHCDGSIGAMPETAQRNTGGLCPS